MKEQKFVDLKGIELIVKYRKSAVFFYKKYKETDLEEHRTGGIFISSDGLDWCFEFSPEVFKSLYDFLMEIAYEIWSSFEPKAIDSFGAEYDDYYDKEFDNNGSLGIGESFIFAGGPYAQPPNEKKEARLMKFNKRKLESFMFDFKKRIEV